MESLFSACLSRSVLSQRPPPLFAGQQLQCDAVRCVFKNLKIPSLPVPFCLVFPLTDARTCVSILPHENLQKRILFFCIPTVPETRQDMESKGENTYPIIPKFRKKFKPLQVKDIIENELRGKLENEKYHVDKAAKQAREITDAIKKKLKGWLGS